MRFIGQFIALLIAYAVVVSSLGVDYGLAIAWMLALLSATALAVRRRRHSKAPPEPIQWKPR